MGRRGPKDPSRDVHLIQSWSVGRKFQDVDICVLAWDQGKAGAVMHDIHVGLAEGPGSQVPGLILDLIGQCEVRQDVSWSSPRRNDEEWIEKEIGRAHV